MTVPHSESPADAGQQTGDTSPAPQELSCESILAEVLRLRAELRQTLDAQHAQIDRITQMTAAAQKAQDEAYAFREASRREAAKMGVEMACKPRRGPRRAHPWVKGEVLVDTIVRCIEDGLNPTEERVAEYADRDVSTVQRIVRFAPHLRSWDKAVARARWKIEFRSRPVGTETSP